MKVWNRLRFGDILKFLLFALNDPSQKMYHFIFDIDDPEHDPDCQLCIITQCLIIGDDLSCRNNMFCISLLADTSTSIFLAVIKIDTSMYNINTTEIFHLSNREYEEFLNLILYNLITPKLIEVHLIENNLTIQCRIAHS